MNLQSFVKILRKNSGLLLVICLFLLFCWRVSSVQTEIAGIKDQLSADLRRQAELSKELEDLRPHRKKGYPAPEFTARSAAAVLIGKEGKEKILFEKEIDQKLPIASISKLMTAYVSLKHYEPSQQRADLLHSIIIGSNNWSAQELGQIMGEQEFIALMNSAAQDFGMENTHFVNPTGLDQGDFNYSTARDLLKFARRISETEPIIWRMSLLKEYKGIVSTNQLLEKVPGVIGGKTGATIKAGECLLLVVEAPNDQGYIINVILGSAERFQEAEDLVNWLFEAYIW